MAQAQQAAGDPGGFVSVRAPSGPQAGSGVRGCAGMQREASSLSHRVATPASTSRRARPTQRPQRQGTTGQTHNTTGSSFQDGRARLPGDLTEVPAPSRAVGGPQRGVLTPETAGTGRVDHMSSRAVECPRNRSLLPRCVCRLAGHPGRPEIVPQASGALEYGAALRLAFHFVQENCFFFSL